MTSRVLLAFSVAGVRLGLDVAAVREVVPVARLLRAPEIPHLVKGFLQLGTELVPVIRLDFLLKIPGAETELALPKLNERLLLARLGDLTVAWQAAEDMELVRFESGEIADVPPGHVGNECVAGVVQGREPIALLDGEKLLLASERARIDQVRQRQEERLALLGTQQAA